MMEGMYGHGYSDYSPPPQVLPENSPPVVEYEYEAFAIPATPTAVFRDKMVPIFGSDIFSASSSAASESCSIQQRTSTATAPAGGSSDQEISSAMIRAKISSHPSYPKLLQAYIDCQKVGAPPEIVDLLDETLREKDLCRASSVSSSCLGDDPELDEFMVSSLLSETYCDMLVKYKSDLARPFDEATTFLNKMESQLTNLCNGYVSDEAAESSEDDTSAGEIEVQESNRASEDRELKDKLLRRYGGYFSSLKHEFSKKKKKGKLPREARQTLFDWWSAHYKWPYPTEADKVALAESTGLDQKQINNWFINQRKRHWKPSENMQFAVMDSLYGSFLMND